MDNVKEDMTTDKCPTFYKEEIKKTKRVPILQEWLKSVKSIIKGK